MKTMTINEEGAREGNRRVATTRELVSRRRFELTTYPPYPPQTHATHPDPSRAERKSNRQPRQKENGRERGRGEKGMTLDVQHVHAAKRAPPLRVAVEARVCVRARAGVLETFAKSREKPAVGVPLSFAARSISNENDRSQ